MHYLEQLQALDEPAKKKVLVVATAVIMIIVIYFWLAYFNNLIAGISQSTTATASAPAQAGAGQSAGSAGAAGGSGANGAASGGNIFANTYGFFKNTFVSMVRGLENILSAPRQYLIQPFRK